MHRKLWQFSSAGLNSSVYGADLLSLTVFDLDSDSDQSRHARLFCSQISSINYQRWQLGGRVGRTR